MNNYDEVGNLNTGMNKGWFIASSTFTKISSVLKLGVIIQQVHQGEKQKWFQSKLSGICI